MQFPSHKAMTSSGMATMKYRQTVQKLTQVYEI